MRSRTTLWIILIVFAATAATFFSGLYFTNESLRKTMEQDLAFAISIADSLVSTEIRLMKARAVIIAEQLSNTASYKEMTELMIRQVREHTDISAISVFDREGVIAGYCVPPHDHDILEMHNKYMEMVYKGNTIFSSPFYCSAKGEFVMNVYTPITSGRYLAMTIPGLTFSDLLSKHRLWQSGDIFMINDEGTFIGAAKREIVLAMNNYITDSQESPESQDSTDNTTGILIQKILSEDSGVANYRYQGVERICAYSRIEGSSVGWHVAVTVSLNESPQAAALRGQTYAALFFLMSGMAAAFFLAKITARPFKKIEDQNRDLEKLNATIRTQATALMEEHERIRLMLDANPLASRLWDRNFILVECNEAAVKLFKLKNKQEYIDRYFELSPEYQADGQKTIDKIKMSVTEAFETGGCTYEWMYQMLDGTPVPAEITMVRVPYGDDYVVASYSRDLREQKKMMSEIEHRDNLLNISNRTAAVLFITAEDENIEAVLMESMEILGRSVNADRVHIMQNEMIEGSLYFTCKYAWIGDSESTGKAVRSGMSFPYSSYPDWENDFMRGKCVNGPVKYFSPDMRKFASSCGLKSMLMIPLFVQGQFWGYVDFSDCGNERVFKEDEVNILHSASLLMAIAMSRSTQATHLRDAHKRTKLRDKLLQTVNEAAYILLSSEPVDFANTMRQCMGMMARAIHADRMYLFKNYTENGQLYCSQLHEWADGVSPLQNADITTNVSFDDSSPETKKILLRGECVHSLIRDLPVSDRAQFRAQDILAVLLIPVFIHDQFWGFVGFDNCHSEQMFSEDEESVMRSGSILITNALLRNEYMLNINETSAKLQTALADAEEANSAKSDFLANMSHEMRTPLNAIIGLSEITLGNSELDKESKLNLEKIFNSGSTLLSIVNDVLDISKIQSGKFVILPSRYDVPSLVNDAIVQNVLRIGSKTVRFILDIDENMPACLGGDELRVKQIINNLLSNAIKFTETGEIKLGVNCERDEHDEDTTWMTIQVSDTGIGMKPEHLDRLFTDYTQFGTTAHYQVGGTGLGLVITKSLAEMMDGTVKVRSKYGEGSVFTVRLRQEYVSDAVIGAKVAESLKRFQYSANKLKRNPKSKRISLPYARVLVVDDNVTNLDVARGLMKPYEMRVDCVKSGRAAVRAIREEKVKYNAVFMDHMMPEMDGIEATRIIREDIGTEYARTVPIIALTANAIAGNEEMFLSKGFSGFISKPIDLTRLDDVIRRFVRDKEQEALIESVEESDVNAEIPSVSLLNDITINGVDKAKALESFGGDETVFIDVLRSYAASTRALLNNLNEYLAADNLEEYAITIHGIKGSSRSIAAEETGNAAEALEIAAKAGEFDAVKTGHSDFERTAEALLNDIDRALGEIDDAAKKVASTAPASAPYSEYLNFTAPEAEILIADDNETNRKAVMGLLKPLRMRMDAAENGKVALRMIEEKQYHLIFMDNLMPVMDGAEAALRLRRMEGEYYRNVPVIAVTADTAPDTRERLLQAGMNDFIAKPIEMKEICEKIRRWLPVELIREKTASTDSHTDEQREPEDLPVIEGIDTREGIRYSGTKELFISLLGDFYKLIDLKAAKIEKCLADGLLRDVTIEVHALKNTARMIGASALSKMFLRLEQYGKEGNSEALARETPAVLEHYRSYKPILRPFGESAEREKKAASGEELISLLKKLASAMDNFDLDGADEAMKHLEKLRIPAECREQMETLRAYVADVAMEEVIKLTEAMTKTIEKNIVR